MAKLEAMKQKAVFEQEKKQAEIQERAKEEVREAQDKIERQKITSIVMERQL